MKNKIRYFIIILIILSILTSCTNKNIDLEQLQPPKAGEEIVLLHTSYGIIKIRLFPDIAPKAVENFITLVEQGYYNNKTFHRIRQDDFIMAVDSEEEDDYVESIWGEGFSKEVINAYESVGGIPELDFAHTVFGQVFEGLGTIDKISNVEVDYSLKPFDPVIIEKAEIIVY